MALLGAVPQSSVYFFNRKAIHQVNLFLLLNQMGPNFPSLVTKVSNLSMCEILKMARV